MKVLNRPMFRYGGPIKEGIMSGIKEPRRGYNQGNMVFPADAAAMGVADQAKAFENIFNVNNMRPVPRMPNKNETVPGADTALDEKQKLIESYTPKNPYVFQDFLEKGMNTTDEYITINTRFGNKTVKNPDYGKVKRVDKVVSDNTFDGSSDKMPPMLDQSGKMGVIDKVIENKGKIEENPELTKKEKVNNILESLGYDRAQKNALYDAMIKAGQRISRTGLGAENLVSDVIAETSQSYDKPEKLREAANLMQVQQDLKLDQIEASKTGGTLKQNYDFYISQGDSKEVAEKKARSLPTTITEKFNASKSNTDSGKVYNVTMELVEEGYFGDGKEYQGRIAKEYDKDGGLKLFLESDDFKGDGVYNFKGEAILIEGGQVKKRQIIQPKVEKEGFFS